MQYTPPCSFLTLDCGCPADSVVVVVAVAWREMARTGYLSPAQMYAELSGARMFKRRVAWRAVWLRGLVGRVHRVADRRSTDHFSPHLHSDSRTHSEPIQTTLQELQGRRDNDDRFSPHLRPEPIQATLQGLQVQYRLSATLFSLPHSFPHTLLSDLPKARGVKHLERARLAFPLSLSRGYLGSGRVRKGDLNSALPHLELGSHRE